MRGQLYLFTASFPYDEAETFLEDEIKYLSDSFERITIIPLYGKNKKRLVPANCSVLKPVEEPGIFRFLPIFIPNRATALFLQEFFSKKVYSSIRRLKTWTIAFIQISNLLRNQEIKSIFTNIKKDDVCYFYWGKGSNVLSCFYNGKARFVSRFHGEWDLWEETSGGYAPLRDKIAKRLDLAAFISKKGEAYFKNKYSVCHTGVFPLGSFDNGICEKSIDGVLRIVSCSTVYPLKRVDLIHDALLKSDLKIEWTHIGAGVDFNKLSERISTKSRNGLKVTLLGQLSHNEVIDYYRTHTVDLFVNLSTNEGVPVSIMEAISFDIPVVATDVGATSEIVSTETGVLLSANPSVSEIAETIKEVALNRNLFNPRVFWKAHYDAEINYNHFVETILHL